MKIHIALFVAVCLSTSLVYAAAPKKPAPKPPSLRYSQACAKASENLVIASIGDVLPHTPLAKQAYASKDGFKSLWANVRPWLEMPDLTYGNLEGPTAQGITRTRRQVKDPGPVLDGEVYTGSNLNFNYHPRMITDLQSSGFDLVSISNNHTFDRGPIGINRTIDAFEAAGFPYIGIRRTDDNNPISATIIEKKGFKIAYVACTEMTNGYPDPYSQVVLCYRDAEKIEDQIRRLSKDQTLDAVIVTPHWGYEYKLKPNPQQVAHAKRFLEAGATAVIGSHPHVLQPFERHVTRDGRETFIAYSLGNFVSGQFRATTMKLSVIVYLGLSRAPGKRPWINGVSYIPIYMEKAPYGTNLLEYSKQASQSETRMVLKALFDNDRELSMKEPIRTNRECR